MVRSRERRTTTPYKKDWTFRKEDVCVRTRRARRMAVERSKRTNDEERPGGWRLVSGGEKSEMMKRPKLFEDPPSRVEGSKYLAKSTPVNTQNTTYMILLLKRKKAKT